MSDLRIKKTSWLAITPLLQFEEFVFWDTPNFPSILPQPSDQFVTIGSDYLGRLDLLAFDYYGDVNYWWAIALANGIDLVPTDMYDGMTVRIPAKGYIDSILSRGPQ